MSDVIFSDVIFQALLGEASARLSVAKGRMLFRHDDEVAFLYLLQDGALHLVRTQENGADIILHRAAGPQIVAEASLYSPRYHCDGLCAADATVHAVPVERARALLRSRPDLAEAWAAYLAGELQATRYRCDLLTRKTVADRLAGWLAWHERLPEKGRWKTLAAELGVTPEALYRALRNTKRGGQRRSFS